MEKPFAGKRIGVLMGGKSGEREVSLRSGAGVLESLRKQGYDAVGIDAVEDVDEKLRRERIEVAFLALHGPGGEDGKIQGLLESIELPYTGSGVTASALAMDKELTKLVLAHKRLPFPATAYLGSGRGVAEQCAAVLKDVGLPVFIKPTCEGSSLGCAIVKEESGLEPCVGELLAKFPRLLVEEYIKGIELTVGILGTGPGARALPVLELVPKNEYYDYEAKYTEGMTELICPARISDETTRQVQSLALAAHHALGCSGVSRVDFIVDSDPGDARILEVNTIPGMTTTSDLPREAVAEGGSYDTLVLEILASAGLNK